MIEEPTLVDTGAFIALYSQNDPAHQACVELARELPIGKAYTCWPVITEAAHLLRKYPTQRHLLLEAVRDGEFQLLHLDVDDLPGICNVFAVYADQSVDLADAALVQLANREGITTVFATDLRHFRVYRMSNGRHFRVLPVDKS